MLKQMIIRIEEDKRNKLKVLARTEGKTSSDVIRALVDEYILSRDMGSYIDDLWQRIGQRLRIKGMHLKDIDSVIREVRYEQK